MIALLDTSEDLDICASELGCEVEQLLTPLTRRKRQQPDKPFAIDNGAFARFSEDAFLSLLERQSEARNLCRFVAVPDIVGSARRTLEVFEAWRFKLNGWPLALVAQDGQEDLPIPWDGIEAIFIGGTTNWKLSKAAADVCRAGRAIGKWVHVGRVNSAARFRYFEKLGTASVDGTGLSRFSWMRKCIRERSAQLNLLEQDSAEPGEVQEGQKANVR